MISIPDTLAARLAAAGQRHVLAFWDQLDEPAREELLRQLSTIDLELIDRLLRCGEDETNWSDLAAKAQPPRAIRLQGGSDVFSPHEARDRGEAALRSGQVGMILVAGGQGTRLGFPHPKGMLRLGPVSHRPLFQIHVDRLLAVGKRYGVPIPLYLMTSPATHDETVEFFGRHEQFGLREEDLFYFCQGVLPSVDARTGKLLMTEPGALSLSPDGHGGMLAALCRCGGLENARLRGITQLFYGQVDNPLLQICDPMLIGYHLLADSEMTTQVVEKKDPLDRVGNVVEIGGRMRTIEYIHMPKEAGERRNADGSLFFWAGSIAVHVFAAEFLARAAVHQDSLPIHRALKKSAYLDESGRRVEPLTPNSIKFERFIFDLMPSARNPIVVEAAAEEAFAPVKNASGAASETQATAQAAMIRQDAAMLRAAGVLVDEDVPVEINPLWALDAADVARRIKPAQRIAEATYFHDS